MKWSTAAIVCTLLTLTCFVVVWGATLASYTESRWVFPLRKDVRLPAFSELYFQYYSVAWCAPGAAIAFSILILKDKQISLEYLGIFAAMTVSFLAIYITLVLLAFYGSNQTFLS